MKKALHSCALVLWMLTGTILLSRWWYANPDHFPHFHESFWHYLDRLFRVVNVDEAQNVELLVVAVSSFLIIAAVTTITAVIVSHTKPRR